MKGKSVTFDMNGKKIFTAHVENGTTGKGRYLSVFELDGNLTLKNGMIEGGRNAVRVNGVYNLALDNMKIYRTQGASIDCVGERENLKITNTTIKYAEIGIDRAKTDWKEFKGGALWTGWGGGRYEIKNCVFEKNTNTWGGAHILTLKDCDFVGNLSGRKGPAALNIGGPYKESGCTYWINRFVTKFPEINYDKEIEKENKSDETDLSTICPATARSSHITLFPEGSGAWLQLHAV